MKVAILTVAMVGVCAAGIVVAQSDKSKSAAAPGHSPELRPTGKHWAKGHKNEAGSYGGSAPLLFHLGGSVISFPTEVRPIYWGFKWADSAFVGDKISGLALFYAGISSHYLSTNTEYTGSTGLHTSDLIADPDPEHPLIDSTHAAVTGDPATSVILAEVCAVVGSAVKPHGYYPVYVDSPRGQVQYCAWHSYGSCGSTPVEFAFFFNLDGDPGCDPNDTETGHSQGLSALANVSGHELSERMTDPLLNAWFDRTGYENSDKCAWTFGPSALTFSNNTIWKVQGNWSNAAFNASRGYKYGATKYTGCIDGTNEF